MSEGNRELTSLKRRMVMTGLGLKPADLRKELPAHPVRVTSVLNGETGMRPEEIRKFTRVVGRRAKELFE
jgi:hypothetical protein